MRFPLLICAIVLTVCGAVPASAQELPAVDPSACTIAPSPLPPQGDVGDLTTPSPTPPPIDVAPGSAADAATTTAIIGTISQSIACQNAGNVLSMLSCFSEAWIAARFSGYDLVFYDRFLDAAAEATPVATDDRVALVSIDDITVQPDGSVLAMVVTGVRGDEATSRLLLIEEAGRWVIDRSEDVPTAS